MNWNILVHLDPSVKNRSRLPISKERVYNKIHIIKTLSSFLDVFIGCFSVFQCSHVIYMVSNFL